MDSLPTAVADLIPSSAALSPAEALETRASSLRRLATLLRLARGAWALAVYESGDVRRQMVDELRQAVAPLELVEVSLLKGAPDPLRIVRGIDHDGEAPVVSFHAVGRQVADLAGYLDLQRDVLAGFPHRLVFWVDQHDRSQLARRAPNFYSRLSGVFYFPGAPAAPGQDARQPASLATTAAPVHASSAVRRRPYLPTGDERQRVQLIDFLHERIRALRDLPRPDFAAIGDAWYDLAGIFETALPRRWLESEAAYLEAARAYAAAGMTLAEAEARYQAGDAALRAYDHQGALNHLAAALATYRLLAESPRATPDAVAGEANVLSVQGDVLSASGQGRDALARYQEALGLFRSVSDRAGEAATLNNIGAVYDDLGEKQQALDFYNQALSLHREVGNKAGEATTLNNIGGVYDALGEKQQALDFFNQALPFYRQVSDRAGEATTLNNIGRVYDDLDEKQQALAYYNQALPLFRQVGNKAGEATTLNNIGRVYDALGEKQQALEVYNQALPLHRQVGNKAGEATTLNNIGLVYDALGEKQQALDFYHQALPLRRQVGDRWGESITRYNMAVVCADLGDLAGAEAQLLLVVALDEAIGHPDLASDRAALARIQARRAGRG